MEKPLQFIQSIPFKQQLALIPAAHRVVLEAHLESVLESEGADRFDAPEHGGDLGRLQATVVEEIEHGATVELVYRIFYEWRNEEAGLVLLGSLTPLNFELEELYSEVGERRRAEQLRILAGQVQLERERHAAEVASLQAEIERYRRWEDPAMTDWSAELEQVLRKSRTEQVGYDLKQGFHELKPDGQFNEPLFRKVVKTLSAMANQGPFSVGYVIVGIADQASDAVRYQEIYPEEEVLEFGGFKITGIDAEVKTHYKHYDHYFSRIVMKLNAMKEVDSNFSKALGQSLRLLRYRSKTLLVFRVKGAERPVFFNDKIYIRIGPSTVEAKPRDLFEVFRKF